MRKRLASPYSRLIFAGQSGHCGHGSSSAEPEHDRQSDEPAQQAHRMDHDDRDAPDAEAVEQPDREAPDVHGEEAGRDIA